jgi:hypothetical protein
VPYIANKRERNTEEINDYAVESGYNEIHRSGRTIMDHTLPMFY